MMKTSPLCASCSELLWDHRRPLVRAEEGYLVRSLFRWDLESPPAIRWLARSMKRRPQPELWREFAHWLRFAFPRPQRLSRIIPIPSRGPNHARGLALALGYGLDVPVQDALLPGTSTQKNRSRRDRQTIDLALATSQANDFTGVLIVDDIVTTGATVGAAYRALGRPRGCEVWCLMDRRRSCRTDS